MEKIEKIGNETKISIDDELLLTITELGDNRFMTENNFYKLIGYCKNLDEYRTEVRLEKNYHKGKDGKFRTAKKLFQSNANWFCYILQEHGLVAKTLPIA